MRRPQPSRQPRQSRVTSLHSLPRRPCEVTKATQDKAPKRKATDGSDDEGAACSKQGQKTFRQHASMKKTHAHGQAGGHEAVQLTVGRPRV